MSLVVRPCCSPPRSLPVVGAGVASLGLGRLAMHLGRAGVGRRLRLMELCELGVGLGGGATLGLLLMRSCVLLALQSPLLPGEGAVP